MSRISLFSKLARDNNTASKTVEADRLHTMFLAMMDVRVALVKLADDCITCRPWDFYLFQRNNDLQKRF